MVTACSRCPPLWKKSKMNIVFQNVGGVPVKSTARGLRPGYFFFFETPRETATSPAIVVRFFIRDRRWAETRRGQNACDNGNNNRERPAITMERGRRTNLTSDLDVRSVPLCGHTGRARPCSRRPAFPSVASDLSLLRTRRKRTAASHDPGRPITRSGGGGRERPGSKTVDFRLTFCLNPTRNCSFANAMAVTHTQVRLTGGMDRWEGFRFFGTSKLLT